MHVAQEQWIKRLLKASCALLLVATATAGFAAETPASLSGVTLVTADQAKKLMDGGVPDHRHTGGQRIRRPAHQGRQERAIQGEERQGSELRSQARQLQPGVAPADKNAAVIFYCNGAECWKSYKASKVAVDAGYKKVNWLRGGIPEWKAKGYPVE